MSVVVLLHDAPNTRNLLNVCQIYHLIYTFTFIPQLVTFNTNLKKSRIGLPHRQEPTTDHAAILSINR
jgi:hypothetical protein